MFEEYKRTVQQQAEKDSSSSNAPGGQRLVDRKFECLNLDDLRKSESLSQRSVPGEVQHWAKKNPISRSLPDFVISSPRK
jgi:hypothetical protein